MSSTRSVCIPTFSRVAVVWHNFVFHATSERKVSLGRKEKEIKPHAFPLEIPLEKPNDRPLSAATARLYDVWNPQEDRGNEFFSNFRYTPLTGLERGPGISRRDPSKVLRIDGTYYVWYTYRRTDAPPAGTDKATDTIPSRDWDLAEVWYATSGDGFHWQERGPTATRTHCPIEARSGCTTRVRQGQSTVETISSALRASQSATIPPAPL
jgi:hypothetical protein